MLITFQAPLRDAAFSPNLPGVETPGYCQSPLRGVLLIIA
jgi:hypothetical protein